MPQISSYFASLGFEVDKASLRKVDNALKNLEKRLKRFGKDMQGSLSININAFKIDQKRLNIALGAALDIASTQTVFSVSRFHIDQSKLNGAMINAMANAAQTASRVVSLRPSVKPIVGAAGHINPRATTNDRIRGRHIVAGGAAGGIAGSLSRVYGPALALGLGGYGLANLNNRNQQIVAAQLQTSAVAQQAGATPQQGSQSFEWLRQQGNRIGFNYLDASADYNKLTSGLTGAGMSIKQSQNVFKGFSELSRVNKLDRVSQQRVYRALSQVAGKNKLQSEELTGQLAESLPGAVSIFAQAYQNQLSATGKGGGKQGQEAITELLAAMKKGAVKGDILTYAGDVASQRAAPGLAAASTASQAEQARFQNSFNDLSVVASNSGVESGFARLFRALNDGLKESGPMVESLAKGFDNVTKYVSLALLSTQSLQRFFEGKDSWLGDKFFPDEESRNTAFGFLNSYKSLMGEIVTLGQTSLRGWKELSDLMGTGPLAKFKEQIDTIANGINAANKLTTGDYSGAVDSLQGFGKKYINTITTPGRAGVNFLSDAATFGAEAITGRDLDAPHIPTPFSNTNSLYDYQRIAKERQDEAFANRRIGGFNGPLGIFPSDKPSMPDNPMSSQNFITPKADVKLDVTVKIDAANPEDFGNQFKQHLSDIVHQTLDKYSEK